MERLSGQVAIITGASSGLGYATAIAMAREGAKIVATARRADRLRMLVREIREFGGEAISLSDDASLEETANRIASMARERFGKIDILINNAGIGNYKTILDTTAAEYDEMMASNVRSGFVFTRAVVPGMIQQESGQIIFVSSVAGLTGSAKESVYAATKFAQVGMAQSLDAELRPYGIKVCAFCPGGMKTEFAIGYGRTDESVAKSTYMHPSEVAEALVNICALPHNVRVPQVVVRHMG